MDDQTRIEEEALQSQDSANFNQTSQPFIGRWNGLVSTTNWEKGRIISQWREALIDEKAPAAQYSDEAWSLCVGGVTGQHVGRLRRVYQRFGQTCEQYDNLYWSHFQASLDWEDDAEMWLEGAVQNNWSVSQMRRQRWETLGPDQEPEPRDDEIVANEVDEDFEPALEQEPVPKTISGSYDEVQGPNHSEGPDFGDEDPDDAKSRDDSSAAIYTPENPEETINFVRPFENLSELPADVSEAFEAYKLAILHHKTSGWEEISREDMLASLDALKELAMAPSAENTPL